MRKWITMVGAGSIAEALISGMVENKLIDDFSYYWKPLLYLNRKQSIKEVMGCLQNYLLLIP